MSQSENTVGSMTGWFSDMFGLGDKLAKITETSEKSSGIISEPESDP